jgi:hypothetical protein
MEIQEDVTGFLSYTTAQRIGPLHNLQSTLSRCLIPATKRSCLQCHLCQDTQPPPCLISDPGFRFGVIYGVKTFRISGFLDVVDTTNSMERCFHFPRYNTEVTSWLILLKIYLHQGPADVFDAVAKSYVFNPNNSNAADMIGIRRDINRTTAKHGPITVVSAPLILKHHSSFPKSNP